MSRTGSGWKTCGVSSSGPWRSRNRWWVWRRSRSCCEARCGNRHRRRRGEWPDEIANTSGAHVLCAVEPKAGRHFTWPTPNRSGPQFAGVLRQLVDQYPAARTIHLVVDNRNTHSRKALVEAFGEEAGGQLGNRLTPPSTPLHGSWLNQAEIEISLFSRQCLGNRRIPDLATLEEQARAWSQRVNEQQLFIDWTFDRKAARKKFRYGSNEIYWSRH